MPFTLWGKTLQKLFRNSKMRQKNYLREEWLIIKRRYPFFVKTR